MNILELAKAHGIHVYNNPVDGLDQLQSFAQAVIEEYKASLVPVAWMELYKGEPNNLDFNRVKLREYPVEFYAIKPLYALGKTK